MNRNTFVTAYFAFVIAFLRTVAKSPKPEDDVQENVRICA